MEEKDRFKRAATSYNQDQYFYQYKRQNEEEKYSSENTRDRNLLCPRLHKDQQHPSTFHSAINPLEYYQDENDTSRENQLSKLIEQNQREDMIEPDEEVSSGSEDNDIQYSDDSQNDKSESMSNSQLKMTGEQHNEEFPQNLIQEDADRLMNDISQEMNRNDGAKFSQKKTRADSSKANNLKNFNERNSYDEQLDTSREIYVSDDMKRSLNNVMEETNEDEELPHYNYDNHQRPPRMTNRASFGQPDQTESEKYDIKSTPNMGSRKKKLISEKENFHSGPKSPNPKQLSDQTLKNEDIDTDIGLNLSKINMKDKKFSDLVISGKLNGDVLKEKIIKNQQLFNEYTGSSSKRELDDPSRTQGVTGDEADPETFEPPTGAEESSRIEEPQVMYSKQLADEFIFSKRDQSWRNNKVNSSCIVSSKSQTDLGFRSDKSTLRNPVYFHTVFGSVVENIAALETDIARNFRNINNKFGSQTGEFMKIKSDLESILENVQSFENRIQSISNRHGYFSERLDKFQEICSNLGKKDQQKFDLITKLEEEFHQFQLSRIEDSSRAEILNKSFSIGKEFEAKFQELESRLYSMESQISSTDTRTKRLESQTQRLETQTQRIEAQTQRSHNSESKFERKCEQIENNFHENLDRIYDQIDSAKVEIKKEMFEELPNFENFRDMEHQIQTLKKGFSNSEQKLLSVEKELKNGIISSELKEDLSQLRTLSSSIGRINDAFKEDVFNLENKIKENSVKILGTQNECTEIKSLLDKNISKIIYETNCTNDKVQNLETLLGDVYDVVIKYNSQGKKSNLQQINQSMMYNDKESKQDLSASFISKTHENMISGPLNKQERFKIYDQFTQFDKAIFGCLALIEKEKMVIDGIQKGMKQLENRVKENEKHISSIKEALIQIHNTGGKVKRKNSGVKKIEKDLMEDMVHKQVIKNFKKFEEILSNLINYENKFKDMDNMMQTIDTLVKERNRRDTFDSLEPDKNMTGRNTSKTNNKNSSDEEESSIESGFQKLRDNRPNMTSDYHRSPELAKMVSVPQNGRSTACQPTIRESPHNLVCESKIQSASLRKSSMPNAPFYKNTRNLNKRSVGSTKMNRHYSTERNHNINIRGCSDISQTNNSCFVNTPGQFTPFLADGPSRQSNQNNYTRYTGISSNSEQNSGFIDHTQIRGPEKFK
ncbi:unnamed protein product [Moneuplotes crassus]|uniref:Uncharacterized protein n=1 Tax=Euplotes crassus TaxID=5936 RepID=A0AAD1XHC6_EUPCR|nr:unnamed protein product [Moneuplotes crassus]